MSNPLQINAPGDLERFFQQQQQVLKNQLSIQSAQQQQVLESQLMKQQEAFEASSAAQAARILQLEQALQNCNISRPEPAAVMSAHRKIALPDKFDGNKKNFRSFLAQTELVFQLNPECYPTDADKVGFIGTLLSFHALKWFTPYFERQDKSFMNDYATFRRLFAENFDDPHREITAFESISKIRQGSRDLISYTSEFQRLSFDLDWPDSALILHYRRGLQDEIRRELIHFPTPNLLIDIIKLATEMDVRVKEYQLSSQQSRTPKTRPMYQFNDPLHAELPAHPQAYTSDAGSVPMDIGAVSHASANGKRGHISADEKTRRLTNNLCLYCGDTGHYREQCPRRSRQVKLYRDDIEIPKA